MPGNTLEIACRLADKMDCGANRKLLEMAIGLIESGAAPEAVAHIVLELGAAVDRRRRLRQ